MPRASRDTREKILAAARRQLTAENEGRFSMRRIAALCGVSAGTIYNHFPDKDSLMAAVMVEDWHRTLAVMDRRSRRAETFIRGIAGIYNAVSDFIAQYEKIWMEYRVAGNYATVHSVRHKEIITEITAYVRVLLERFAQVTKPYYANSFEGMNNAEALAVYDTLEREILDDFITPIANDMGAMVFYGMLTDQLKKQQIAGYEGMLSAVISKQGDVESAEQSAAVLEIVKEIRNMPELKALFEAENAVIMKHMQDDDPVFRKIAAYIRRFGARTMDELKLETVTLFEDPSFLLDTIRGYLHCETLPESGGVQDAGAEQALLAHFGAWKRPWIRLLLRVTKYFIRNRESLRLRRTYIYSVVRNIYLRIGKNLEQAGMLAHYRDVFYLEKAEISEIAAGRWTDPAEIRQKAEQRKAEFSSLRYT